MAVQEHGPDNIAGTAAVVSCMLYFSIHMLADMAFFTLLIKSVYIILLSWNMRHGLQDDSVLIDFFVA